MVPAVKIANACHRVYNPISELFSSGHSCCGSSCNLNPIFLPNSSTWCCSIFFISWRKISCSSVVCVTCEVVPYNAELNDSFYKRIEPLIIPEIFNNKVNASKYIGDSLKAYNDNVEEIAPNVYAQKIKALFKQARLDEITDDLFN